MRKVIKKWNLLLIVGLGISLAWTNKRPVTGKYTFHRYAFKNMSMDFTKYYSLLDITSRGYLKGLDYSCDYTSHVCSFAADQQKMHIDGTGTWFYASDVPPSGIDDTGTFYLISF
ncbi:MAG TPA: hypothetical protein VHD83_26410 [Puia sp.]|nr:hypothetical protein [Puia sp.]